ncbi:MAG: ABC transporter permease subunit [Gemmatimonadetes bacterium]|nr:ABC transporter permease subunit [Gemmatimonadota bacterium]MYA63545.1 ABC transporter permease subunit [Gemmatimonadota bacterium]MYB98741.1 ABC transporter permease subunit [Gemmatimonadota bacterium]MYH53405.1 ABC transporter permease subunit [Gemmatimonadota bacterium]MYI46951.1 ABC transporter permease subunit [Gemmatimonadota bacterium]
MKSMMKQVLLIARRELRSFFDQPTAYVLAVAFLGLGLYLSFRQLYAMQRATLRPFFDLLPWLLMIFIPAIAMRTIAEERRSRTLEWLIAQPLSEIEVVLGKFLGSWLFVLITLAGTLPMALGVLFVSEADSGIVFAQYVGAALLTAQMLAVGIWASAITRNQITAFILGAFTCFLLVLIGSPVVQIELPRWLGGWLLQLSVISHFENVGRGVIDLRDLLYFASTCGLFLLLAVGALGRERLSLKGEAYSRLRLGTGVLAVGVLVLNLLGGHVRGRLDLTDDNLFTLSDGSREILGNLDDIVNLTLFLSDDLPQEIQVIERDVKDLVADLEGASDGMLAVREINPDDGDESEEEASSMGIMPIEFNVIGDDEFQVKRGYFGLALTYADAQEIIPVIDRADDLEFRLVSAIASMTTEERPRLAFMTGFGAKEPFHYRGFRESLADRFDISSVNMETDSAATLDNDSIDVLVVAAPETPVSPEAADAIGGYLDAGGAALLLIERHAFNPQSPMSMPVTSGLEDMLAARGVKSTGELMFDAASASQVQVQQGIFRVFRRYALWPIAIRGNNHATNRDLNNINFAWASPVTWQEDDPTVTPLWTTTENGGVNPAGSPVQPGMELAAAQGEPGVHTFAVAVDPSLAEPGEGENDDAEVATDRSGGRFIVVGDGDFLEDGFVQPNPQNLAFAANAVDWLVQDEALINIRSKDRTPPALVFESDSSKGALKWTSLIGVPALFILLGFARVTGRTKRAERRWREGEAEGGKEADDE